MVKYKVRLVGQLTYQRQASQWARRKKETMRRESMTAEYWENRSIFCKNLNTDISVGNLVGGFCTWPPWPTSPTSGYPPRWATPVQWEVYRLKIQKVTHLQKYSRDAGHEVRWHAVKKIGQEVLAFSSHTLAASCLSQRHCLASLPWEPGAERGHTRASKCSPGGCCSSPGGGGSRLRRASQTEELRPGPARTNLWVVRISWCATQVLFLPLT